MRIKRGTVKKKRKQKLFQYVKGFYGGKSKLYRTASDAFKKALAYAYRDRRTRKRDFRTLWILRINAAARQAGLTYAEMTEGLRKLGVILDRRMLGEMAASDEGAIKYLAGLVKENA